LIIVKALENVKHYGVGATTAQIRNKYWIM